MQTSDVIEFLVSEVHNVFLKSISSLKKKKKVYVLALAVYTGPVAQAFISRSGKLCVRNSVSGSSTDCLDFRLYLAYHCYYGCVAFVDAVSMVHTSRCGC